MIDFWSVAKAALINQLQADPHHGLTEAEARRRLSRYGLNELPKTRSISLLERLGRQLSSPLSLILIVTAIVITLEGSRADMVVVWSVIIINTAISFIQERSSDRMIEKLHSMLDPTARVIRQSAEKKLPARLLVPGDIIKVSSGDRVPADCRLLNCQALTVNQASLTGESLPEHKRDTLVAAGATILDRTNIIFASTLVVSGQATALVVATGGTTELGRIAESIARLAPRSTNLELQLRRFGRSLGLVATILVGAVFLIGLNRGVGIWQMLQSTLALLVSIVPEGLPIALTVALAVSLKRLYRRRVLIRRLDAMETLGQVTVLAVDKTGTLTEGAMMVEEVVLPAGRYRVSGHGFGLTGSFFVGHDPIDLKAHPQLQKLLELTCLTTMSTVTKEDLLKDRARQLTDPTETALAVLAAKGGFYALETERHYPELLELPFDNQKRYSASIHRFGRQLRLVAKGAAEEIIERSTQLAGDKPTKLLKQSKEKWLKEAEELASHGYRVVAVAYADYPASRQPNSDMANQLTLVGLLALDDPVRPEARQTIDEFRAAGVRVLMITGDHLMTAEHVVRKLGLETQGAVIHAQDVGHVELAKVVAIARATPADKLVIVERLERLGEVVAMTGDGVNDAPALKRSAIGVTLGRTGTDIAIEASEVVLRDDQLSNLWQAMKEGRLIDQNIKKILYYLISTNFGEVLTLAGALIIGWPLPLLAIQILWLNLVTDGVTSTALAFEPAEKAIYGAKPKANAPLLGRELITRMLIVSVAVAIGSLLIFNHFSADPIYARTATLTTLVFFQLLNLFNSRSLTQSVFSLKLTANRPLLGLFFLAALLQLAAVYLPPLAHVLGLTSLNGPTLVLCLLIALSVILVDEVIKLTRTGILAWARAQVDAN